MSATSSSKPSVARTNVLRESVLLAVLLTVVIVAWGGNYVVMKLALATNGPWTFNALRYGIAALLLGIGLGSQVGCRGLLPIRQERRAAALVGFLQASVMTGCTTWALTHIEASRTVLITYSMPIWALLFAFLNSRETVSRRLAASVALGFAGLAVLCAPWSLDWTTPGALAGSSVALVGSMAWALGAVFYRSQVWTSSLGSQIFLQMLTAVVVALICAALFERQSVVLDLRYSVILVYNALVPTILAFWVWAKILKRLPAATAGQFVLLSPIVGIVLGSVVLAEPLTPTLLLSTAMILGGALIAYIGPRGDPKS